MKKVLLVLLVLFISATGLIAQSESASSDANATVISPIQISNVQSLEFGNIIADSDGGTVSVATDGTPSYVGISAPSVTGTIQQSVFNVVGLEDATYDITLPTSITLDDGNSNTMLVDNFVSDPSVTGVLTGGSQNLNVGATLNVGSNQVAGSYSGSFNVTVAYN